MNPNEGTSGGASGYNFGIQQNYFKIKMPQLGGATFWGGKQYYERRNIDMIDFFYLNTSDTGVGVEDVDLGFGKLSFSIFGADKDASLMFIRPDLRVYGIPVNPGGSLMIDLNVDLRSSNKSMRTEGDNEASTGFWVTVEHSQTGIMGGNNLFVGQFANGLAAGMGGALPSFSVVPNTFGTAAQVSAQSFTDSLNKDNMQYRFLDALLLQPSKVFQVLIGGSYAHKQFASSAFGGSDNKIKEDAYGVFARPKFWFGESGPVSYFNIQGDIGYTAVQLKDIPGSDNKSPNLIKGTIALAVSPAVGEGGGFFVRPEIRLYGTFANWNKDANEVGGAFGNADGASSAAKFNDAGDAKSGGTFGVQAEGWF